MEDTNLPKVPTPVEAMSKEKLFVERTKLKLAIGALFAVLIVGVFLYIGLRNKETATSFIDKAITSIEKVLKGTDDIDQELSDLPEDFLDSEAVSEDEVDESITELDAQIEALDTLEADFELESNDVGLE